MVGRRVLGGAVCGCVSRGGRLLTRGGGLSSLWTAVYCVYSCDMCTIGTFQYLTRGNLGSGAVMVSWKSLLHRAMLDRVA